PDARVGDLPVPPIRTAPVPVRPRRQAADPPRTDTERRVAEAWCAVLGLEHIDRDVNLFEAGASSLSAARLHVRLCAAFDVSLPITDIFRCPTVASMAEVLDNENIDTNTIHTAAWLARIDRRRQALHAHPGRGRRPRHPSRDHEGTD
ncbi:acyl carrier protein, partial [Micromonospora sonneratiae]